MKQTHTTHAYSLASEEAAAYSLAGGREERHQSLGRVERRRHAL